VVVGVVVVGVVVAGVVVDVTRSGSPTHTKRTASAATLSTICSVLM
jgi:hypothetical protein